MRRQALGRHIGDPLLADRIGRLFAEGRDLVIGDATSVIERLKTYEALGYDEYSFWIDSGMSFDRKKASLERFISDVMPAFG